MPTRDYLIRRIDADVLARAHTRARAAGKELAPVLRELLRAYADGHALAADLGRRGGTARAAGQSAARRREIARAAASARWAKRKTPS